MQNKHSGTELRRQLQIKVSCFYRQDSCFDRYLRSKILDNISRFAMENEIVFQNPGKKLKFNFFRILSLDFSFHTIYDFLIGKERTPNSQKSARISFDSKSISDSVFIFYVFAEYQ